MHIMHTIPSIALSYCSDSKPRTEPALFARQMFFELARQPGAGMRLRSNHNDVQLQYF